MREKRVEEIERDRGRSAEREKVTKLLLVLFYLGEKPLLVLTFSGDFHFSS